MNVCVYILYCIYSQYMCVCFSSHWSAPLKIIEVTASTAQHPSLGEKLPEIKG